MSSKGRTPSDDPHKRHQKRLTTEEPTKSTLSSLPCDAWRTVGEMVGLESLHRLARTGQRSMSNVLKRVLFRRLEVTSEYLKRLNGHPMPYLLSKMQFFAEIQSEELVISSSNLSPELIFLAARMVSSRSRLPEINYSVSLSELYSIPWTKMWSRKCVGVFVRGASDGSSAGDFATLSSLSFTFFSDPFDKLDDAEFFHRIDRSEAAAAHQHLRLEPSQADGAADELTEESLFNASVKVVPCPVFIANPLLSGLYALETLELNCDNLRDERHFDLRSLANLTTFGLSFIGGPKGVDTKYTAIRVSATERMTTLKLYNREEHRRHGVVWGGFPLCTRNVPNIRRLEMRCALWPQYWRRHKDQLCETLEELSLDLCILSDDAWTASWPPLLRVLELKAIGIAKERMIDYSFWEQIHRDSVQHWRSKIRHLDPRKLPATLEKLIIEDMGDANVNDLELLGTDIVTSWNVDTERYIESARPKDFSCALIGDGYACRWGDYLNLCFSEQTLQSSSLPCSNLTTLELGMHYGGVSNLDLLPSSLTRLSVREITRRMPLEVDPLHSAFTCIFPSAEPLLNRDGRGLPNLRSLKLLNADWSFLLPFDDYMFSSLNIGDIEAEEAPQSIDLLSCVLQSAFAVLIPDQWKAGGCPRTIKTLLKLLNPAWSAFKADKRTSITNWRFAFNLPERVHTLVWNPDMDTSARLKVDLTEDADELSASDSDSATAEVHPHGSPDDSLQSSSPIQSTSMDGIAEMDSRVTADATSCSFNLKDLSLTHSLGDFGRFVVDTPWKWSFVGRHLKKLELRCVKRRTALDVWNATLPFLDSLFISEDLNPPPSTSSLFELRNCSHALRELVLLTGDWSLVLPHVYANIPLAQTIERLVTSNTFDDEQIALMRRAIPTLESLEIRPLERLESVTVPPIRASLRSPPLSKYARREHYLENMLIMRGIALSYVFETDADGNGDRTDYAPLASCYCSEDSSWRSTSPPSRFPILREEGTPKYKVCEPATLVFTGATWTASSHYDTEVLTPQEMKIDMEASDSDDSAPKIGLPKTITLDLIRSRLTRDVFNGVHFERISLDPDLSVWTVPEGTEILDLTEDEAGADPALSQWSFSADSNIAIRLHTLKLPHTLTRLTLIAVEDDPQSIDIFSLLPASLLELHILNQTRSKTHRSFVRISAPPPNIQDIFVPNIFILHPERQDLSWAPTSLRRLVCSSRGLFQSAIPETIKTLVVNGNVLKQAPKSEKSKYLTRLRRKERSNSLTGDKKLPTPPAKKKSKME